MSDSDPVVLRLEVIELDPSDPLSKLAEEAQGKMQAAVADLGQRYPDLLEFAQEPPWWKSEPDLELDDSPPSEARSRAPTRYLLK